MDSSSNDNNNNNNNINMVETAIVLSLMLGVTIGMYIVTQISDWIDKKNK